MEDRLAAISGELGVFLRVEALELGYSDRDIANRVRAGAWHRVRWGAYIDAPTWAALDDRGRHAVLARAVLRQARTDAVLSHVSSLPEYDVPIWDIDLDTVHVTRHDHRSGRRERGVRQHSGLLLPDDYVTRNGVPVTSATRSALDITTVASTEQSLVVVDALLHGGATNLDLLANRYRTMEQWPNTLHTDLVLRLADGRSESPGETRTRYLCWRNGLPAPKPQYPIKDRHGRIVAWVDLAWPEHGVFLEFDGKIKYGALLKPNESPTDVVVREKQREELICELTGWRCIRIVWADLYRPEHTAMRIRRMLDAGAQAA